METEVALENASREELLLAIAAQRTVIADLRRRVERLEAQLRTRGPSAGMPGIKPSAKRGQPKPNRPRKRRPHGFARRRMEPTQRVVHVAESCPECGTGLSGGWVQRTREVIELPVAPAEVIEHVFVARTCPLCDERRMPQDPLEGLAMGRRRLGPNLASLIVTLREEGRLPFRSIQWYLQTVHQLKLSVGAIVDLMHVAAQRAQPVVAEMLERIRASPVVHADETGWRQDGVNGYVWTFSTPTERYFLRRGRGKAVVDEVLGESDAQGDGMPFSGVLVSDFYAAYSHYPGLKQRCWAHLLRDIDDLKTLYPQDSGVSQWAAAVRQLYERAKVCADDRSQQAASYQPSVSQVSPNQLMLERLLLSLCKPFCDDDAAPQA